MSDVLCWCIPGSPELPVRSPHRKNDYCSRMDSPAEPTTPTEREGVAAWEEVRRIAHDAWQNLQPPQHFDEVMADAIAPLIAERERRAAAAEAKVARVEALADEWEVTQFPDEVTADLMRHDLRAALADDQ